MSKTPEEVRNFMKQSQHIPSNTQISLALVDMAGALDRLEHHLKQEIRDLKARVSELESTLESDY